MCLCMSVCVSKGGFPAWLLTENKDMILRTSDPCELLVMKDNTMFTALDIVT